MKRLLIIAAVLVLASCSSQTSPESQEFEANLGNAYVYAKDSAMYDKDKADSRSNHYYLRAVITVDGNRTLTEVEVPHRLYNHFKVGDSIPSIVY